MTRLVSAIGNCAAPWAIQDVTRTRWIKLHRQMANVIRSLRMSLNKSELLNAEKEENISNKQYFNECKQSSVLVVNNISKSFQSQVPGEKLEVLKNISFNVHAQEVFSILGPNGSGKTTIINIVAGLLKPDTGDINFLGKNVDSPSHQRTVVFQSFALFPWRTCLDNVLLALEASACEENKNHNTYIARNKKAKHFLRIANLNEFADTYPIDLSGGMKQRLALVRALAVSPSLILMDEPFASFDPIVREKSQETILDLLSNRSATILLVTHDLDEAIFMSDRILVLS